MRASEFIKEEQKLDEILPLIGLAARGIAGGAAKMAGRAALKGAGALAKGAARTVGKVAGAALSPFGSDDDEEDDNQQTNNPNATVGGQTKPQPSAGSNKPVNPAAAAQKGLTDFRPGAKVNLPTTSGRVGNFKVTKVTGDEVEIENPDKFKLTGEPDKLTFTRDELASLMGNKK